MVRSMCTRLAIRCRTLNNPSALATTSTAVPVIGAPSKRIGQPKCPLDNENDYLGHCETFRNVSAANRKKCLELKRCFNCLGTHRVKECESQSRCKSCNGTHHTLLHKPSSSNEKSDLVIHQPPLRATTHSKKPSHLLQVLPESLRSNDITLNTYALLDMGSTCNFLQESANKLTLASRLAQPAEHIFVKGIHNSVDLRSYTQLAFKSKVSEQSLRPLPSTTYL